MNCLNCGASLTYHSNKAVRRYKHYCSMECRLAKPLTTADIEREQGKPIRQVLLEHLNTGAPVQTVADLLGVTKQTLYRMLKRERVKRVVVWR